MLWVVFKTLWVHKCLAIPRYIRTAPPPLYSHRLIKKDNIKKDTTRSSYSNLATRRLVHEQAHREFRRPECEGKRMFPTTYIPIPCNHTLTGNQATHNARKGEQVEGPMRTNRAKIPPPTNEAAPTLAKEWTSNLSNIRRKEQGTSWKSRSTQQRPLIQSTYSGEQGFLPPRDV